MLQTKWSEMEKEEIQTSSFKNLNIKFNYFLNTMSTKLVFGTRHTLYKSMKHLKETSRGVRFNEYIFATKSERGDVPGWVLVVLMTTGLVTGIWTVAQPRLSSILKNSLDNMNNIR